MPEPDGPVELWTHIGEDNGETVVFVAGDLDLRATAQMSDALNVGCSLARNRLVVDVSGLAFMDAAGIRAVVSAHNRLLREGRAGIVVRGASGIVRRIFALTECTSLLDDPPPAGKRGRPSPRVPEPVPDPGSGRELDNGRRDAGLSLKSLFVAYFALGGTANFAGMVAHLEGSAEVLDTHQRDVAAHALNERLVDLGRTERLLSYASDHPRKGPG